MWQTVGGTAMSVSGPVGWDGPVPAGPDQLTPTILTTALRPVMTSAVTQ
jgi:hypothetical protein